MDGKALAERIRADVAREIAELGHVGLATVLVGDDPASDVYIRLKQRAAKEAGIDARDIRLDAATSEEEVLALVAELNGDDAVDGILVQLPLPAHIDETTVTYAVAPTKDVDGFHPVNAGQPLPRDAAARPRNPGGLHGAARGLRRRPEGEERRRDRPERDRRAAGRDAAPPGARDRDDLPFADGRPRARRCAAPTSSSPPSASRGS